MFVPHFKYESRLPLDNRVVRDFEPTRPQERESCFCFNSKKELGMLANRHCKFGWASVPRLGWLTSSLEWVIRDCISCRAKKNHKRISRFRDLSLFWVFASVTPLGYNDFVKIDQIINGVFRYDGSNRL